MNQKLYLILISLCLAFAIKSEASHFRYANISWSRADASTRTITVTVNQAWRWATFGNPAIGTTVNVDVLSYGDGTSENVNLLVTSVDAANDNFYGTFVVSHTYAGAGTSFALSVNSCCRIGGLLNNSGGSYSSFSIVNLVAGNLGSPISTMPPVVNLQVGLATANFPINGFDPDGTALTYALSTAAEAAGGNSFTQPSGLSVNSSTGIATFSTVGTSVGNLFSASVKITDGSGSTTMVDFVIKIVSNSNAPIFSYGPTPANNSTLQVAYGNPLTFTLTATDVDAGNTVTISGVGLQSGMSFSPALPAVGTQTITTNFSWTPTISQLGSYALNFTATDNNGVQSNTIINIQVISSIVQFIAPTPSSGSVRTILPNVLMMDTISAININSVDTRLSAATIPSGATLSNSIPTAYSSNPTTIMSWTPAVSDYGLNTISFTGTDLNASSLSRSYNLIVNSLPTFTSTPITTAYLGAMYSYTITAADADIPFGDVLDIMLYSTTLPSWLTLTVAPNGESAVLSGIPSCADAGSLTIQLIAEDIYHHSHADVIQSFTLTVDNVQPSPTMVSASPSAVCAGGTSQLNASSAGNTINWYTTSSGGSAIGTSASGANFPVSPASTTTYYAEANAIGPNISQVYLIPLSSLVGFQGVCSSTLTYGSGVVGFNWTDILPASTNIVSVSVELSIGVECIAGSKTTTLNGLAAPSFNTNSNCTCGPSSAVNGIITVNLNPLDYIKGGLNQFRVTNASDFGFMESASLSNSYARVVVVVPSQSCVSARVPVTINVSSYDIVSSVGLNGTISPLGTTSICSGANQIYTIAADGGYHIDDILVDGVSNSGAITSGTYTFSNVTTTHTIHATFAPNCTNNTGSHTVTQCNSYTWVANNNTIYTLSGNYQQTYTNIGGCDSIHTLQLTINYPTSSTTTISQKGCYTWNANSTTYTITGIYTVTMPNSNNCDSVLTLNLTIIPGVYLNVKALLSGPFVASEGKMHDSLRVKNLIPTTEPYSASPFNKTPIGNAGAETLPNNILSISGDNAIVDWVIVELRSANNPSNIIANRRALLQRDGDIVSSIDGTSPVAFDFAYNGTYYISVQHRNHLGIMTANPILLNGCSSTSIDLSGSTPVYSNPSITNAPRKQFNFVYALWSSDASNNKNVKYNGLGSDKEAVLSTLGGPAFINAILSNVYRAEDVNMDGKVRFNNMDNDRAVILMTVGVNTPNIIMSQHTPN